MPAYLNRLPCALYDRCFQSQVSLSLSSILISHTLQVNILQYSATVPNIGHAHVHVCACSTPGLPSQAQLSASTCAFHAVPHLSTLRCTFESESPSNLSALHWYFKD